MVALRVISGKPCTGFYGSFLCTIAVSKSSLMCNRFMLVKTYLHIHPCWRFLHTGMRFLHSCSTRSVSCNSPGGYFLETDKSLQSKSGVTVLESFHFGRLYTIIPLCFRGNYCIFYSTKCMWWRTGSLQCKVYMQNICHKVWCIVQFKTPNPKVTQCSCRYMYQYFNKYFYFLYKLILAFSIYGLRN